MDNDFFKDQFEETNDEDCVLQAAAREAGWALSNIVDEVKFEKRQQVVNIINRLSAALVHEKKNGNCIHGSRA